MEEKSQDSLPPDPIMDFSDPMFQPPQSPEFHGFGSDTKIPGRLILNTDGEDVQVTRSKRTGRPRGKSDKKECSDLVGTQNLVEGSRRSSSDHPYSTSTTKSQNQVPVSRSESRRVTPKQVTGTMSRPNLYLLETLASHFGSKNLPKSINIPVSSSSN